MKDKNPEDLTEFSKNKIFVMTRPDAFSGVLSITTPEMAKENDKIKALYQTAFFDCLLNVDQSINNELDYSHLLDLIAPTLAYQLFSLNQEAAINLVEDYLNQFKNNSKEIEFVNNLPDAVSSLDHAIRMNFLSIFNMNQVGNFKNASDGAHNFIKLMEQVFMNLPAAYCFVIINKFTEFAKKNKKTNPKGK